MYILSESLLGNRLAWPKATVFEIVIVGSNPTSPASYVVLSVPVRTSLCESDRMGSTPIDQPNLVYAWLVFNGEHGWLPPSK